MMQVPSTKPYLIRALHEWCVDNGYTPHLLVAVGPDTRVPMAYVKNGEIVLNLSYSATKDLLIGKDAITFSARFGGVSNNLYIPIESVRGLFSRENGQGMVFQEDPSQRASVEAVEKVGSEQKKSEKEEKTINNAKKPSLTLVK